MFEEPINDYHDSNGRSSYRVPDIANELKKRSQARWQAGNELSRSLVEFTNVQTNHRDSSISLAEYRQWLLAGVSIDVFVS